jgi:predicted nucleotidyltransferase
MIETREPFEGFAVETVEGLIFTVKGLVHPPDRVIAYLRYLPDSRGDRERDGTPYRRVYYFEEQEEILQTRYPDYLIHDPVFGTPLQGVPKRFIRQVYDPRRRLETIRERGPVDPVEEHALDLADLLRETAGVPTGNLGVSGSVLVGLHQPDSDIDLVAYGEDAGRAVHQALRCLLDDPSGPVRRPDVKELEALHAAHRPDTPLSLADFGRLQNRKVNEGRFRGREYFIRFVKQPVEVEERYGDPRFEPLGPARVRAQVTDDGDAAVAEQDGIFTPCRYAVEAVTFLEGTPVDDLREIVSFRGRFAEQVRAGERAVARGSLEQVIPRSGPAHHRLVVGGRAGDYLMSND